MNAVSAFNASGETPHQSIEAEQQLLGAILTNNALYHRIAAILSKDHFYDPVHADIWEKAGARIRKEHIASPVTLKAVMETHPGLQQLGGPQYLIRLAAASIGAHAIKDYAGIIVEMALKRQLDAAMDAARAGMAADDLNETVARLQHALHALPQVAGGETSVSANTAAARALQRANEAYTGRAVMLKTGVGGLDKIIKGLGEGDLLLIGGATSMGKTALAVQIADNIAFRGGGSIAYWSLEMEAEQIIDRMISSRARIPYSQIRDAETMEEKDFRKWVDCAKEVSTASMRIIPKHIRDIAGGHAAIRRASYEVGEDMPIKAAIVDYAQLLRGEGRARFEQMSSVATGLKTMAGLLKIPVIGLVQLDRKIGERDDPRPQLSDIKESGQFENDADQVVFCHREEYWMQRKGPAVTRDGRVTDEAQADWRSDMAAAKNKMELIVRKNRHGPLATAQVGFHAPTNKFWDLQANDDEGF